VSVFGDIDGAADSRQRAIAASVEFHAEERSRTRCHNKFP